MSEERLQKVMAAAGVGSRRTCERMIAEGRVQVNGHTVTELGTKVNASSVTVTVNGLPIRRPKRHVYVKVYKTRGILSDIGGDARGRRTVADLVPADLPRVFPVGRLDLNSEGLILLTDDGALAHRLTHPRFEHPKTYYVLVGEMPSGAALTRLRNGVDLPDGRTAPAQVRVSGRLPDDLRLAPGPTAGVWLEIVLREGKKRQIRHMTAAVGCPTLRLVRWAIGPLQLGSLAPGATAYLTSKEIAALLRSVSKSSRGKRKRESGSSRRDVNETRRRRWAKN
jgi:23S rRNA pseudouridine2605 synthase